jgi:hypothetical protein
MKTNNLRNENHRGDDDMSSAGAARALPRAAVDSRIAATADRLISMRDGAFVDETRLTGGATGNLGALAGLDG